MYVSGDAVQAGRRKGDEGMKYWVVAPRDVPEIGVKKGDLLLVDFETGYVRKLERYF